MRHVSGVEGAAPIWHDVMEELLKGRPERQFREPPGLARVEVCTDSGLPPASQVAEHSDRVGQTPAGGYRQPIRCSRTLEELFIVGTQPTRTDDWHWRYRLDRRNGLLAGQRCPPEQVVYKTYTLYPSEAQEWARRQGIPQPPEVYSPLCPAEDTQHPAATAQADAASYSLIAVPYPLTMISPDQGGRYRLSPQIPRHQQRLSVAAQAAQGVQARQVTLLVDDHPLATLHQPPYRSLWTMEPGQHRFSVVGVDVWGNPITGNSVTIEVVE